MSSTTPSRPGSPPWLAIAGVGAIVAAVVVVALLWLLIGGGYLAAFGSWMHTSAQGSNAMVRSQVVASDERRLVPQDAPRRAYAAPSLRYLGTVYELTLTGAGSGTENGPFPKPGA